MELAGKYIGIGLGDASEEVGRIRDFMRRKFPAYAGNLPDTRTRDNVPLYDAPMTQAVLHMQSVYRDQGRLNPVLVNGVVGLSTKVVMGYLPADKFEIRPMLFTVCGTGVPWWVGPDADTARALDTRYKWQPIGYRATAFPMEPSIEEGKRELLNQLNIWRAQVEAYGFSLASYSQGAVIASETWEFMKRSNHWAVPHFLKSVTWGNPSRELGKVYDDFAPGQKVAGPNTSGVAYITDRLHDTPLTWRDYAHAGDLYAAVEQNGPAAQDKTAIWRIVRDQNLFTGPDTLLQQFLELAQEPLPNAIGMFKAMMDAGMFFGGGLTQHTSYNPQPAIDFLRAW